MRFLFLSLASALAIACSSGGGGGGAVSCADGGACPTGYQCGADGFCFLPAATGGNGGTGNFGGFGGGSGGTTTGGACDAACTKATEVTCANPVSATCVSDCMQARSGSPGCTGQFDAFLSCQIANGSAVCDADGDPTVQVSGAQCDAANQAFVDCVSGGTGGTAGTAGSGGFGTGGSGTGGFGTGGTGTGGFGTGGTGTGGTGAKCGLLVDGTPACDTCGETFCCSQLQGCGPGTICNQLLACIDTNCPTDASCINTTCSQFASGTTQLQAIQTCVCNSCSGQCSSICS